MAPRIGVAAEYLLTEEWGRDGPKDGSQKAVKQGATAPMNPTNVFMYLLRSLSFCELEDNEAVRSCWKQEQGLGRVHQGLTLPFNGTPILPLSFLMLDFCPRSAIPMIAMLILSLADPLFCPASEAVCRHSCEWTRRDRLSRKTFGSARSLCSPSQLPNWWGIGCEISQLLLQRCVIRPHAIV